MSPKALLIESLRSGTIASLVIMPLGWLFRAMGLRIGYYGPKFAAQFIDNPQPWQLFVQHLLIGCISALPLLLILVRTSVPSWSLFAGAVYGAAYYVLVNSLALPLYFGDPTPWQLGWATIYPSLIGHMVFGASIGLTARRFVVEARSTRSSC